MSNLTRSARINWTQELLSKGLPEITSLTDPAWFAGCVPSEDEGWSLKCVFDEAPSLQGNPSFARVHFVVDNAPHDKLVPGASLLLFERGTRSYAQVDILE